MAPKKIKRPPVVEDEVNLEGVVDGRAWKRYGRVIKVLGSQVVIGLKKEQLQRIAELDVGELVRVKLHEQVGRGSEEVYECDSSSTSRLAGAADVEDALQCLNMTRKAAATAEGGTASATGTAPESAPLTRKRVQPDRFDPFAELTSGEQARLLGRGDGIRRQLSSASHICSKPECVRARAKYDQLKTRIDRQHHILRGLSAELDDVCDRFETNERIVVQHLQHALMELMDEEMSIEQDSTAKEQEEEELDIVSGAEEKSEEETEEIEIGGHPSINGTYAGKEGALALGGGELTWTEEQAPAAALRICISDVISMTTNKAKRPNPFASPRAELKVNVSMNGSNAAEFCFLLCYYSSSQSLADVEAFLLLLAAEVESVKEAGSVPLTAVGEASTAPAAAGSSTLPNGSVPTTTRRTTARMVAGRNLRQQLINIARLRHDHKIKHADELLASLSSTGTPNEAPSRVREDNLAKQRVRELRDCCFSMGGFSLTQRVLDRFLKIPEVRLLLPEAVRKERQEAVDAETSKLLLSTAKEFLSKIFRSRSAAGRIRGEKGGGRRSDEDRNAYAAALAALLPASLFENHRGRAAMRILGISYRQAKLGSRTRGELEDWGRGWKRINTSTHSDKVEYAIVTEFWHSELASDPDNQNKCKVRVELGRSESGERLYDFHEQRAQCGTARALFSVFHASQYAARFRLATQSKTRPNGCKLGWDQFLTAKCACIKERKPSECDCQSCTYITENLRLWHRVRHGYFKEGREQCCCEYHLGGRLELKAAIARDAEEAAWLAASAAAAEDSTGEIADAALEASAFANKAQRDLEKRDTYEGLSRDLASLQSAIMPCGRVSLPRYSLSGASIFKTYQRACVYNNCQNRLFRGAQACGWDRQYPVKCPLETCDKLFSWRVWEQRVTGENDEGQPSYTPEFSWKHGKRAEFVKEFVAAVTDWLPHAWRDQMMKQGLRLFEDYKSGRPLHAARQASELASLQRDALRQVVRHTPSSCSVRALARVATRDSSTARTALQSATAVHDVVQRVATVQSDYAAQIQTKRSHTATCARPERHNCLVVVVGYKSFRQQPLTGAKKRKAGKHSGYGRGAIDEFRQHVDVFFAFHDATYKPSARSYNVVREDIDHYLKHGTFLHGEWFTGSQRCPGGDHSKPLPEAISERPIMPPDFPEYEIALEVTDGAPTQFANATNHHQTAVWHTKTGIIRRHAKHVEHHGKSSCDGYANVPTHGIHDAVRTGAILDPTTRNAVLYLAQHKAYPAIEKEMKPGWMAADRYFYAYMNPSKFTKRSVPDAEADSKWKSKSDQDFVGMCQDPALAEKEGCLRAGRLFCACGPCAQLKFDSCEMVDFVGKKLRVAAPLAKGTSTQQAQLVALHDWADSLQQGMLVAIAACKDEQAIEGVYWLAKLLTGAYGLPADIVYCGEEFKEGWLVVEAHMYSLEMPRLRGYRLLSSEKTLILVNSMVRIAKLKFSGSASGPQRRALRSGGMEFLGDDEHHLILDNLTHIGS